jgi:hypothetical protein
VQYGYTTVPHFSSVTITGPYNTAGVGDTPSRRRIFVCRPTSPADEERCARQILAPLVQRAFRRAPHEADFETLLGFFRQERGRSGSFDAGIELALRRLIAAPEFIFRFEPAPAGVQRGVPYRVSDTALASRLSFFLWSSIPDDELLRLAIAGKLREPAVLEQQTRRMLADPKARALVSNFAAQWLYLRDLKSAKPDDGLFPDFDENLRQAFQRETELLFDSIVRENRSVLDLLDADYTFVNERLAKHYGIPNVYGSRFRRIELDENSWRGGLLRQGSVLTVTSYATRTSPVLRGKWVLDNILGVPPPPPPPNVPALRDNTVDGSLSGRRRLAEHRSNAICAGCHNLIDPVGLSLEKFDAVGRRRTVEDGAAVDATGGLPDGSEFVDVDGLERALLGRPTLFVETFAEKLMTYALGRGVEYYDAPAIRAIVRGAAAEDYRMSAVILGVVNSKPFQMRMSR